MHIVNFKGQLGNQMFQYAFALYLSDYNKTDVFFDSTLEDDSLIINQLSVDCKFISDKEIKNILRLSKFRKAGRLKRGICIVFNRVFNSKYYFEKTREIVDVKKLSSKIYFDGYWQNWHYVEKNKDILKKSFYPIKGLSLKAREQIAKISERETVCLGIRLGDYISEKKHYMVCDSQYYRRAINYCIKNISNPLFYVFSNDIRNAKSLMKEFESIVDIIYREDNQVLDNYEELWVMTACRHSIIPNSTFHWWAAWLKDESEHIIIAPEKWFGDGKKIDIIPSSWIKM